MATIYPRKLADGQVVYCVNFVAPDGRRRRKIIGPDLQLAREYLNQLRVELQKARMGQPLQPLSIPEAALRFLEEIKADRSPGTFVKYRFILRTFLDYLSERWPRVQNLGDITPRVVNDFKVSRLTAGKAPATVKADLQTINRLFSWSIRMDYCGDSNPVRKVDIPRPYRRAPRTFSPAELEQIFAAAGPRRDFYETLYRSGFRLDDACHIRVRDIDLPQKLICYHNRKGRRDEWVEINSRLVPIFEKRIAGKGPDGFVFPEEQATRGSRHNNLRREFKRLVRSLGLEDATLHDFKRSFVTHLFESGKIGDPRIIQVLAHHESLDTTLRYARQPSTDQMRGAVDNLPV